MARPTTLGACQVRLQESMLLVPITARANFCTMKFSSLVDLEHEKNPMASGPYASLTDWKPAAARASASSHDAVRKTPLSRTIGSVIRVRGAYSCRLEFFLRPMFIPSPYCNKGIPSYIRPYDPYIVTGSFQRHLIPATSQVNTQGATHNVIPIRSRNRACRKTTST